MERRMQERLVGAIILVALVVLVVPELLSGSRRPAPAPTTVAPSSVVAPSSAVAPMRTVTVDVAASRATPSSSVGPPVATAIPAAPPSTPPNAASVVPGRGATTAKPPSTGTAAPAAAPATHGRWTIQLGSFADRANALRLARRWKKRGYAAYVSTAGRGARALHRVRMGAFTSRDAAVAFARKLRAQGQRSSVVPPGH